MANPTIKNCTADTWVKVATNVTAGLVHMIDKKPSMYLHTYRMTGNAAPLSRVGGVVCDQTEIIEASAEIDVYIYAVKNAGKVRVDLP